MPSVPHSYAPICTQGFVHLEMTHSGRKTFSLINLKCSRNLIRRLLPLSTHYYFQSIFKISPIMRQKNETKKIVEAIPGNIAYGAQMNWKQAPRCNLKINYFYCFSLMSSFRIWSLLWNDSHLSVLENCFDVFFSFCFSLLECILRVDAKFLD